MRQQRQRVRGRVLFLAGLLMASYPLLPDLPILEAQGGQGGQGGGQAARVINAPQSPLLQGFRWREIGPTGQGGRIDDIAVDERNPSTYYIGYAVSGLWKTKNMGTTFEPLFDEIGHSIGDIAIAPSNPNVVYVGTGEPNNRQSSSFGNGVYKTTTGGESKDGQPAFQHVGLEKTESIGRILVHPKNPDIVWVAAVGRLFGPNEERGVFMSTDGGKTWNKTLYINQDTGATELVIDPANPNHLFAATYERRRTNWGFVGGGLGSGIHESMDGGKSWKKVASTQANGLPRGTMGRIAMDWCRSNPNMIYAQIEVAADKEPRNPEAEAAAAAAAQAGRGGGGGGFGGGGRGGGQAPAPNPTRNGIWRSMDRGKTWEFRSNENQRPMYFSQIRCDPNNPETVYVGGVNPAKSTDGARSFNPLRGMGHVDNHAIWVDPNNSQHVMYGNDGGLDVSWDGGDTWESVRLQAAALPYHVSADMRHPYWVCTGLQDNGSWCGPSSTRSGGIHMWNWISVGGGDGFQTQIDPTDPNIFYTESQNGAITRYDLNTGQTQSVRPQPAGGGGRGGGGGGGGGGFGGGGRGNVVATFGPDDDWPQAYNWNSPIRLSPHNPQTVLFGGTRFFVSRDRGQTWSMSQPLGKKVDTSTRSLLEQPYKLPNCGNTPGVECILSKNDGLVANEYGTIIEIAESPVRPGVYWAGTNDGNLQMSRDGGQTWTEVGKNIPGGTKEYHVSGIEASWYDAGTAYVALDGHWLGDMKPYVYKTTDFGQTWTSVAGDLPTGNVNSIRQDPRNRNLLYAAAEFGFYVSLDEGKSWHHFMPNLPKGRIDEILVHPRDNDLILAHHGRGIWIMDDITALQQLTPEAMSADATLFEPRDAILWKTDRKNQTEIPGGKWWEGEVAPRGTAIAYHLKSAPSGQVLVKITNTATGQAVRTCVGTANVGLNRFQWTLTGDPQPGGGGGGGRGGGRGAQQPAAQAPPAPTGPTDCTGGGGGGGGRGGGRGGGFGGGGIGVGTYRVTLSIGGKEVGSQTFQILEDIWLNEK